MVMFDNPYDAARGGHVVLVLTGWDEFRHLDLERLRSGVALPNLVDGVNVLDPAAVKRAGFTYQGVGRR
jgi:UDPglucose 6-dehydrogenase